MKHFVYFYTLILVLSNLGYAEKNLTLEEVWGFVVDNHEEVKRLEIENYQANLQVRRTIAEILPKVGANASITYANPSKEVDGTRNVPTSFKAGGINVTQSLIDFRFRPAFRSAKYAKEATAHQTEFELYELLYLVSEAYLAVLQSNELLKVAENQLELARHQFGVTEKRYEAGEVPVTDLLRSKEEVNRALRALHDFETDVHIYWEHLSNFAGIETECYSLSLPNIELDVAADLACLIQEAGCRREDIQSAAAAVEAAKEVVRTLKRTNWPKVDFIGEYTLASPETLTYRNNSWSAAFWLTLPVFDGGVNHVAVKNAEAEVEKHRLFYEQLVKGLSVQIKTAYYELRSSRENFHLLENEMALAKENYEILSARYANGHTSNIDLLDALTAYIQAQANFTIARYNLILLSIKLKKETGFFGEFLKCKGVIA